MNYDEYTQARISQALSNNKDKVKAAQRQKIPNSLIYLNSLNILCGKQGSGKTMTAIKEIIKISENSPETHLLIYINKTGKQDDLAFEATKDLIKIPIMYVSQADAIKALKEIFEYKQLYKDIKSHKLENQMSEQHKQELYENVHIDNMKRPFLHTLILFEDTANSPLLKDKFILDILARCRHYQVSCFLPVQYWKALTPALKENASVIFFFGGVSPRGFYYFISQVYTQEDHHEIFQKYNQLGVKDMMVLDNYTGESLFLDRFY